MKSNFSYVSQNSIAFLTDRTLQAESQVMAGDHNATTKALFKWLHIWLDA